MKTLFKGGKILSGNGLCRADLLTDGEKILAVGENLPADGAEVRDVSGKILMPGFIDAHTHFDLDVCNTTTADDFASGTRSAVLGGTTCVVDFACPNKGETLAYGLDLWHKKADGKSSCDYAFHMTIDDWTEEIRKELPAMFREGISSFKMYMTYPAMMIGDAAIEEALRELNRYGGIAGVHCENSVLIDSLIAGAKAAGKMKPASHPQTRPNIAEAEAVKKLLEMAKSAGAPVVIVHLSARQSLEEVRKARKNGQTVYVETCPQYLLLEDKVYENEDYLAAAKFICAPPIRKLADADALWRGLENGDIQTVSTDHCSFTCEQKMAGKDDFTKIPGGLPGVETRGVLLWSEGVKKGKISEKTFCRVLSENPAKLYGMYPQKGTLAPGSDADIVVFDPEKTYTLKAENLASAAAYTPFEGMQLTGAVSEVYLRGERVVAEGKIQKANCGKYIPRGVKQL